MTALNLTPDRIARFWSRCEQRGDCLIWTGATNKPGGYGQIRLGGKLRVIVRVHRLAYELTFGAIPDGLIVRHTCDNTLCCEPGHLELGTQTDNMRDMIERGRAIWQVRRRRAA